MREPKGHPCPECGTPRGPDNTPSCGCARRASDALRETRTAEAAAAEDFNPLRIRPYVEIADADGDAGAEAGEDKGKSKSKGETGDAVDGSGPGAAEVEVTMPLRPVRAEDETSVLPTPLAPSSATPNATDLRLFEAGRDGQDERAGLDGQDGWDHAAVAEDEAEDEAGSRRGRSRRGGLLLAAACAAVVAVVAAAGFASGLFSYDPPARDGAAPREVRESVPVATTSDAESTPASEPTAPTSAAPSVSGSASPSPSPTPSASKTSATPSPTSSPSTQPTQTATVADTADSPGPTDAPVLRRGDQGAEVVELQLRLRQLNLYVGDVNGNFNRPVENAVRNYQWARGIDEDELGVYGPVTRQLLESETAEP
ncbi:peptidoglycan-binding protein [Streptomyces sp. NPDC005209]|uniref:peptidoglycan-binding domain-containing protein n=1 Tax=Streptomyces sp. NPDC005209 TaxID=3156715 RepID=UPI0033A511CE